MNRWLIIGSLACLLIGTTGCLHHNTRSSGGCSSGACSSSGGCKSGSCNSGGCNTCSTGSCNSGKCGGSKLAGLCGLCGGKGGCRPGCRTGAMGWQQGGHDYSSHLQPGMLGHTAGKNLRTQQGGFTPGAPTAQVGYPYYTVRGPRDFLLDNPPTIGR